MSELLTSFDADTIKQEQVIQVSPDTTVLITEQQVLFATAAVTPLQQAARHYSEAPSNDTHPRRRHYPSRNDFLEDSRMAREMMRL